MYVLNPRIKQDAQRRWALPDRIFYGHGACHILAGLYLQEFPNSGFEAVWVKPWEGFSGNHIFVTNGQIAFDYYGYSLLDRLVLHHKRVWTSRFEGWGADQVAVEFSLLDTEALNARNMRGPDQYYGDAMERTQRYLDRVDHNRLKAKVKILL